MLPRRKISVHQEVTEVRTRKTDVSQVTWGDSSFILFTVLTKLWQILFFFFLAVPLDMQDLSQLGIEPAPLPQKRSVLSTGPPGGSQFLFCQRSYFVFTFVIEVVT